MSASLVGSEMCIRDSVFRVSCVALMLAPRVRARVSCVVLELVFAFRGSVSYTHLTLPTICSV
eukprot:6757953-Alexandrium_andersonii.AAC.1